MSIGVGASLFVPVKLVCEWTDGGRVNEPLNLLSSAVFFLTAWLLWCDYRRTRKDFDEERLTLIALLALIGVGSAAFHADANRLTLYADTVPVSLFISFAGYITLHRVLGLTVNRALLLVMGLGTLIALTNAIRAPYRFNESVGYIPVLGGLAFLAWRLRRRDDAMSAGFWLATGLLAAGLALRSIDNAMCPSLPSGTYFLWRLSEGLTLYCLASTIRERRKQPRPWEKRE